MIGTADLQIDTTIEKLFKAEILPAEELIKLCEKAKPIFTKESNIVPLKGPVTVVGDIHGQFWDLLEIFKLGGALPETNYLFLGDYVNRGCQSLEVISLLFALKVKFPEKITMIRGNHECRDIAKIYGFYEECNKHFGSEDVWKAFHEVFDCLPLAALIGDQYLCVHGGLSPELESLDSLKTVDRFKEIEKQGLVCDIIWSDPGTEPGWIESPRGASFVFGPDVSKTFNAKNNLKLIIRAHQLVMEGYSETHDKNVVTIFSAPNYAYTCANRGAIMKVEADLKYSFIQFDQLKGKDGEAVKIEKPVETEKKTE